MLNNINKTKIIKMTTTNKFIYTGLIMSTICLYLILNSCTNSSASEISEKEKIELSEDIKIEDLKFLEDASLVELELIALSQLTENNSITPEVIKMGELMVKEHKNSFKSLQLVANQLNVSISTSLPNSKQEGVKRLKNKNGFDFDKQFCEMMIMEHEDAINLFENGSLNSVNPEIVVWAEAGIKTLKKHLVKLNRHQSNTTIFATNTNNKY